MKQVVGILVLIGCAGDLPAEPTGPDCLVEFSVENGFGHLSDDFNVACAVPPDDPDFECPEITPATITIACDDDGHPCAEPFITREAALCVAGAEGLGDGLDGLHAHLGYNYGHQRPFWGVSNITQSDENGGRVILIDAITGEVLERSTWQRVF